MNTTDRFSRGMGIGGWLTNYKRFQVLPEDRRMQLTVGDFEHFESFISTRDAVNISRMGMDHVRIGFDQLVLEESAYQYRTPILKRMRDFADDCAANRLSVVLNLHKAIGNYCDIAEKVSLFDSRELQDRFVALWVKLEEFFSDRGAVAFELLNEVRNIEPSLWNSLAARTVEAIRKLNPNRKIIIGSASWNSVDRLKDLTLYDDPEILYTFHFYDPFEFTHQRGVLMAEPLFYNRVMEYPSADIEKYRDYHRVVRHNNQAYRDIDAMDIRFIRNRMKGAVDFLKANPGKKLWCGEFGTIRHCPLAYRENWMRDVITVLRENNIPYCVWNYLSTPNDGNRFSLVDDDTRAPLSPELLNIIRGEV